MTCHDVIELVEAIAAGDLEPDMDVRAHLESCRGCASALATARRVEAALARREAPAAPPRFSAMVLQRIRREQWRAEQQVDRLFNVTIVVAVALLAGGAFALMNLSGLLAAAGQMVGAFANLRGEVAREAAPSLATYVAAAGLLLSALGMWWWAERRLSL
jgi:hypothetical protein